MKHCWLRRRRHRWVGRTVRTPFGEYETVKLVVVCEHCGWHSLFGPGMFKAADQ